MQNSKLWPLNQYDIDRSKRHLKSLSTDNPHEKLQRLNNPDFIRSVCYLGRLTCSMIGASTESHQVYESATASMMSLYLVKDKHEELIVPGSVTMIKSRIRFMYDALRKVHPTQPITNPRRQELVLAETIDNLNDVLGSPDKKANKDTAIEYLRNCFSGIDDFADEELRSTLLAVANSYLSDKEPQLYKNIDFSQMNADEVVLSSLGFAETVRAVRIEAGDMYELSWLN